MEEAVNSGSFQMGTTFQDRVKGLAVLQQSGTSEELVNSGSFQLGTTFQDTWQRRAIPEQDGTESSSHADVLPQNLEFRLFEIASDLAEQSERKLLDAVLTAFMEILQASSSSTYARFLEVETRCDRLAEVTAQLQDKINKSVISRSPTNEKTRNPLEDVSFKLTEGSTYAAESFSTVEGRIDNNVSAVCSELVGVVSRLEDQITRDASLLRGLNLQLEASCRETGMRVKDLERKFEMLETGQSGLSTCVKAQDDNHSLEYEVLLRSPEFKVTPLSSSCSTLEPERTDLDMSVDVLTKSPNSESTAKAALGSTTSSTSSTVLLERTLYQSPNSKAAEQIGELEQRLADAQLERKQQTMVVDNLFSTLLSPKKR
mmetsp:Transcript_42593/g.78047  ORF Transcript_42593/g.78047 Transcript_42593/m.78047 type:complete len:373 (+) Transcript_42593:2-1120(+)